MGTHWQTDLCDMQKIAKYNAGYKYVLTCFDVFSKFGWAEPIKDKSSFSTAKGFEKILGRNSQAPWFLYSDKGQEYTGAPFQTLMKKKFIMHTTSESPDVKAASVE